MTLFDGTHLDNFNRVGNANWTLANGIVEATSGPGFLVTKESYDNFEIRVEFWVDEGGNSGVFIRVPDKGAPWQTGYEVQISNDPRDDKHCTGALYGIAAVKPRPDESADKWHNFEIHCVGPRIKVIADGVTVEAVQAVRCCLAPDLARIVDQRDMTDINVQYLVARTLVDGRCTFAAAHDEEGSRRADVAGVLARTTLVADPDMEPIRQARVEVDLADGRTVTRHVFPVRGTKDDPMSREEVEAKADDLMSMALPAGPRDDVIDACRKVDETSLERIGAAIRAARDMG